MSVLILFVLTFCVAFLFNTEILIKMSVSRKNVIDIVFTLLS